MSRGAIISITLLAFIGLVLIMLLSGHGVASTVDEGESKTQTNEINAPRSAVLRRGEITQPVAEQIDRQHERERPTREGHLESGGRRLE